MADGVRRPQRNPTYAEVVFKRGRVIKEPDVDVASSSERTECGHSPNFLIILRLFREQREH